jgi:hypothetical protein
MGKLSCPKCGSSANGGYGCLLIGLMVLTFPIGLLLLLIRPTYTCRSKKCGHAFKP